MPPKSKARGPKGKTKSTAAVAENPIVAAENTTAEAQIPPESTDSQQDGNEDHREHDTQGNPNATVDLTETTDIATTENPQDDPLPSASHDQSTPIPEASDPSPHKRGFTPINKSQPSKKYQPKTVTRRTQEEREAFEREQKLRQNKGWGGAESSRGSKSGRGGSDRPGHRERGRDARASQASGIFGGPTIKEKVPRAAKARSDARGDNEDPEVVASSHEDGDEPTSSRTPKRTSTKVKEEDGSKAAAEKDDDGDVIMDSSKPRRKATTTRTKTKVKTEEPQRGYISDDARWDDDVGPKVELAKISLLSEDESDSNDKNTAAAHLRPVRLDREEHQEPSFGVNTEASSLGAAEIRRQKQEKDRFDRVLPVGEATRITDDVSKVKRKPRDVNFVRAERRWKGVYEDDQTENDHPVKQELRDEDAMDLDVAPPETFGSTNEEEHTASSAEHPAQRRRKGGYFHPWPPDEPIPLDEEDPDLAEMARIVQEVREEEESAACDTFDSAKMDPIIHDLSNLKGDPAREGKIYLMQLPPVMPKLRDFTESQMASSEKDPDTVLPDAPSASSSTSKPSIKPDPDTKTIPPHILNADSVTSIHPPTGCTGTISFYKSGKIMANWGGLELEVNQQHRAGFAQEVLLHDWQSTNTKIEDKGEWEETTQVGDVAYAVGEVEGGFVAGPDLGSLLGRR